MPFDLIKGRQKVDVESDDIENRLTATRERQRLIKSKYLNRAILPRDQRELETLEDEEMVLNRRLRDILADKSSFIQRLLLVLRPFEVCTENNNMNILTILYYFSFYLVYFCCV